MALQEEMHSLAQGIMGSYEARVADGARIRQEVSGQLRELDAAHRAMARQLWADLAQGEAHRKAEVNAWMKEVRDAHASGREAWQHLVAAMGAKRAGATTIAGGPAPSATEKAGPAAPTHRKEPRLGPGRRSES